VPRNDDDNIDGRVNGEQHDAAAKDHIGWRLLYVLLIAFMLSISQTVLTVLTVIQFIIMLVNNGERNAEPPGGFRHRPWDLDGQGRPISGGKAASGEALALDRSRLSAL
jgi:hypothetical protein